MTACTALAAGAPPAAALRLWAIQGYAVLGSNFIPIPGAMGVADYLMLRGFQVVLTAQAAASLEAAQPLNLILYLHYLLRDFDICGLIGCTKARHAESRRRAVSGGKGFLWFVSMIVRSF